MKKRIYAFALTLCMLLSMFPALAANPDNFTDIRGHWGEADIIRATEEGLFEGLTATTFGPEGTMSRAMFVTILYRLDGEPRVTESADFRDPNGRYDITNSANWYAKAVSWASANNIVTGTTSTTFSPDDFVTRQQMAAMIVRYCTYAEIDLPEKNPARSFTDSNTIESYAREAVAACQVAGIINGMSDGRFAPYNLHTRAEAAAVFARLLNIRDGDDDDDYWVVTFNSNGGSAVASQRVKDGETAVKPTNPTLSGKTFQRWNTDAALRNEFNFSTPITEDITLYASWTNRSSGSSSSGSGGTTGTTLEFTGDVGNVNINVTSGQNVSNNRITNIASGTQISFTITSREYVIDAVTVTKASESDSVFNVDGPEEGDPNFSYTVTVGSSNVTVKIDTGEEKILAGYGENGTILIDQYELSAGSANRRAYLYLVNELVANSVTTGNPTITLTFPYEITSADSPTVTGSAVIASDDLVISTTNNKQLTVTLRDLDETTSFGAWADANIVVVTTHDVDGTATPVTFNISLFPSAAWNVKVNGTNGTAFVDDSSPTWRGATVTSEGSYITELTYTATKVQPNAGFVGTIRVTDKATPAGSPTATVDLEDRNRYIYYNLASRVYEAEVTFEPGATGSWNLDGSPLELIADQYGNEIYFYVASQLIDATDGTEVTLTFPTGTAFAADGVVSNDGSNVVIGAVTGNIVTAAIKNSFDKNWDTANIIATAENGTAYRVSLYPSALWFIEYRTADAQLTMHQEAQTPPGSYTGAVTKEYFTTDTLHNDDAVTTWFTTNDDTKYTVSIIDYNDNAYLNDNSNASAPAATIYYIYIYSEDDVQDDVEVAFADTNDIAVVHQGDMVDNLGYIYIYYSHSALASDDIKLTFENAVTVIADTHSAVTNGDGTAVITINPDNLSVTDWDIPDIVVMDTVNGAVYSISFYDSAAWEVTEKGEGKVVLVDYLNGDPHNKEATEGTSATGEVTNTFTKEIDDTDIRIYADSTDDFTATLDETEITSSEWTQETDDDLPEGEDTYWVNKATNISSAVYKLEVDFT